VSYDVIIVGSGCAGLSAAYRLAPDHDVLVVDQAGIGEGTSSRASGVITAPVDYPNLPEWSAHATEFFRELDGTGTFSWTDRPYVRGVRPEDVEESKKYAEAEGVSLVDAAEYDEMFAADAPYSHALVWENCGYCDVDEFLATLHKEAITRGAEFRPDTTVESVIVEDDSAVGVETEFGSVRGDNVVVAAGSATRALLLDILPLPLRKFTWNVAYLDADLPDEYMMGGDSRIGAYWRRTRDDHLLVGVENRYESEPTSREEEQVIGEKLTSFLADDLPGLLAHVTDDTDLVRYETCPMADTTTPDARGIIDAPAEAPDGLVVAAGFHGAGVMATDSIGTAIRARVTGEDAPFSLTPFRLDRFDTRDTDFPFSTLFQASS